MSQHEELQGRNTRKAKVTTQDMYFRLQKNREHTCGYSMRCQHVSHSCGLAQTEIQGEEEEQEEEKEEEEEECNVIKRMKEKECVTHVASS